MLVWTDHLLQILNHCIQIFHDDMNVYADVYFSYAVRMSVKDYCQTAGLA